MSTSELFKHYAQQCIELAEISGGSNRDLMLSMAHRWLKLADLEQRDGERETNEKEIGHGAPPTTEVCPKCREQMTVTQVMPTLTTAGLERVTYKCTRCGSELERTFQLPEPLDRLLNLGPTGGVWRRGGFERVR